MQQCRTAGRHYSGDGGGGGGGYRWKEGEEGREEGREGDMKLVWMDSKKPPLQCDAASNLAGERRYSQGSRRDRGS